MVYSSVSEREAAHQNRARASVSGCLCVRTRLSGADTSATFVRAEGKIEGLHLVRRWLACGHDLRPMCALEEHRYIWRAISEAQLHIGLARPCPACLQ
jgi:hypothetical protein